MENQKKFDEKTEEEIKKNIEARMKELGIDPNQSKSKHYDAITKTIAFIITAPLTGLVFIGILAYSAMAWGLVLNLFWKWFLLPAFPTLPQITFVQAIGLMMIVNLFDKNIPQVMPVEMEDKDRKNMFDIIAPWLTLLVGWIIWFFLIPIF